MVIPLPRYRVEIENEICEGRVVGQYYLAVALDGRNGEVILPGRKTAHAFAGWSGP